MSNVKISQLPEITLTTGTERFLVVQGGVSKQVLLNKLFNGLKSNQNFDFDVGVNDFVVSNNGTSVVTVKGNTTNNVGIFNNNPLAKLHVGGSCQIGLSPTISSMVTTAATTPAIYIAPYDLVRNTGTISLAVDTTLISVGTTTNYTLGAGTNGQTKTIIVYDVSNGASASIAPTNALGFTTVNMSTLGASVTMKYVSGKWAIIGSNAASISQ